MAVVGIDTSNYRTSICIIDQQYRVIEEQNPLLAVEEGELGLQQSKAVFEHLKSWSAILAQLRAEVTIDAVGVSVKPRPLAGSYMPVFKVGEVLAETIAHFLSVPLYRTSHQEGHIAAAEYALAARPTAEHFLAVHISGGTSEILACQRSVNGYTIDRLGGTLDLHTGQFVDRVGVKLGLPFPAGPYLERLAAEVEAQTRLPTIPSAVKGVDFSFSGPATAALRLIEQGSLAPSVIARAVENTIAKTFEKSLLAALAETQFKDILLVGGVASNQYIVQRLKHRLEHRSVGATIYPAPVRYATDNAFGVACIAQKRHFAEQSSS